MKNFKYLLFPIILLSSVSASHRDKQLSLSINTNYRAFSDDTEPSSSEGSKEEQEVELKVNSSNFSTVTNRSKSSSYTDFLSEQKSEEEQGIELIELKVKESNKNAPAIVTLQKNEENCCPFIYSVTSCLFVNTDVCREINRMSGCDNRQPISKCERCWNCTKCTAGIGAVGGLTYVSTLCCGFNGTTIQTVCQSIGTALTCYFTSRKSCQWCCSEIWFSTRLRGCKEKDCKGHPDEEPCCCCCCLCWFGSCTYHGMKRYGKEKEVDSCFCCVG